MQLQLHYANYTTPHCIQLSVRWPTRWPLQPSVDSLGCPCITTSHLSYTVLCLKLPLPPWAVLVTSVYDTYHHTYLVFCSNLQLGGPSCITVRIWWCVVSFSQRKRPRKFFLNPSKWFFDPAGSATFFPWFPHPIICKRIDSHKECCAHCILNDNYTENRPKEDIEKMPLDTIRRQAKSSSQALFFVHKHQRKSTAVQYMASE